MLADTVGDPKKGIDTILDYAIAEHSKNCRMSWEDAFVQLLYCRSRNKRIAESQAVKEIFNRNDVREFVDLVDYHFSDSGRNAAAEFKDNMLESLEEYFPTFTDDEKESIIDCVALNDAADYLGYSLGSYEETQRNAEQAQARRIEHEKKHGNDASASVSLDYFKDIRRVTEKTENPQSILEKMRLFRMVAGVRSLIGKKTTVATTKKMIAARCMGGKSYKVAEALAEENEAVADELTALASRYRFDRILNKGGILRFYVKLGIGRRIHLSTKAINEKELMKTAIKKPLLRAKYHQRQQEARAHAKELIKNA